MKKSLDHGHLRTTITLFLCTQQIIMGLNLTSFMTPKIYSILYVFVNNLVGQYYIDNIQYVIFS